MSEIDDFLASTRHNEWIHTDKIKIYLRKSHRYLNNLIYKVLDIGTVEVSEKTERGKGHFKVLLAEIIEKCPYEFIYIENVQEQRFAQFFEKNGWTRDIKYDSDYCYYKRVRNQSVS